MPQLLQVTELLRYGVAEVTVVGTNITSAAINELLR